MKNRDGGDYEGKKWDVYVYGDVNIDLVVPGVSSLPKPGQEDEVPVMDTYVGGGAALFALGIGKLGLHPVFQGEVGDDCYGELIRKESVSYTHLVLQPHRLFLVHGRGAMSR